jgi:outer membrane protein assembly factor BamB
MKRLRRRGAAIAAAAWATAAGAEAADWPQYRGPQRSGVVSDEDLLSDWTGGGPRERWRRSIGAGFSSVAIVGGRLFTMEALELEEAVLAIDAGTGETVWRRVVGQTDPELFPGTGPRATPTIAGGLLFTVSSGSRLLALDAESGDTVWERDLTQFGPTPRFGYSMSPLVDGDNVVVLVGDRDRAPGIVSFDRASGEERWRAIDGPAGYSSPIVAEIGGVRQYVFSTFGGILGLSTGGEELWFHETGPKAALPMPVFGPPDRIFVATSDDSFGGVMIRVTREGDTFGSQELWSERLMRNHFNTSVLVGGHLYGFDNATFRCLDASTGERRWAHRGFGKGSLVASGDLLYVLADNGTLGLVHADPATYREVGRVKVMDGRSWTAPSLAHGHLYLRDADELVSLDLRTSGSRLPGGATASVGIAGGARGGPPPAELTVDGIVARYIEARGGAARWNEVDSLRFTGVYAAFSEESTFELVRRRGDIYRLDFELLEGPAIRARDERTAWWQHPLLQPEPAPVGDHPYRAQLEREAVFGPLLLDRAARGLALRLAGSGEINGIPTVALEISFPDGGTETWHLDSRTFLEVAVDSQVYDFTQFEDPTAQRAFFSDFRKVQGLVLPFRVDTEFGARLEEMRVRTVEVDPELDSERLRAPPAPPPPPAEPAPAPEASEGGGDEGREPDR